VVTQGVTQRRTIARHTLKCCSLELRSHPRPAAVHVLAEGRTYRLGFDAIDGWDDDDRFLHGPGD